MGATNISMSVKGNEDAVRKAFKAKVASDLYDYGHDPYNGSFTTFNGLEIKPKVFNCQEAADRYLCELHPKWGPAWAVRYKAIKPNQTMVKLAQQVHQMDMQLWRGKNPAGNVFTPLQKDRLEKKLIAAKANLEARRNKKADKIKRTVWLVGGWAAC